MVGFADMTDLDRPYDPDPLEDGARVRIRLSGECFLRSHNAEWNGREGVVTELGHRAIGGFCSHDPGHPYIVVAKKPPIEGSPPGNRWSHAEHYARAELERIP